MKGLKNRQKIGKANGIPSLPTRPTQVMKMGNVGSVDVFRAAHLITERVENGLKKSAKNRGRQWYAQSAQCAHTGHVKGNASSLDASRASQQFTVGTGGRVLH